MERKSRNSQERRNIYTGNHGENIGDSEKTETKRKWNNISNIKGKAVNQELYIQWKYSSRGGTAEDTFR